MADSMASRLPGTSPPVSTNRKSRPFQEAMTAWCWGFGWGDEVIEPKTRSMMNLAMIGALAGVMGSLQALEAIKEIARAGERLAGRLLIYDALDARVRTTTLKPDPECATCGH